jgi:pimeloyl-ACP methyl ester carboxylesterase
MKRARNGPKKNHAASATVRVLRMKKPNLKQVTLLAAALVASPGFLPGQSTPAGHWEGAIELPGTQLKIKVDLVEPVDEETEAWSGTIDIPAQMIRAFALGEVEVDGSAVSFTMPNIPGDPGFDGQVTDDGEGISGTFRQGGQSFPFSVARAVGVESTGQTPSRGIAGEGLAGIWQGSLRAGPVELRLVLHVDEQEDGSFKASLDSLDQGAMGIPVSSISGADGAVLFEVAAVGGKFEGRFNQDGSEMEGTWTQGGNGLPLVFKRIEKAPDVSKKQDPKKPYPYDEREVTFENADAGITLAGTLTVPRGEGPFPAVVLMTGSGPQNRNEELLGHRPFLVLADHLTRKGIAVLRYDDRGVGASKGNYGKATHEDFADDARAAFEFLKAQEKIDPKRVGLCGHSEGGVHAPIVAANNDDVAFIVMLAGVGVPMDELLKRQRNDMIAVLGLEHVIDPREVELSNRIFDVLRDAGATPEARKQTEELTKQIVALYSVEQRKALQITDAMIEQQRKMMLSPWFVALLRYDPVPTLARVHCPVLAINGDKDVQVAADENLEGIRAGLNAGGNEDVTIVKLAGLNHLFQKCTTGAVAEYGAIEETFNPVALNTVSDWILKRFGNQQ